MTSPGDRPIEGPLAPLQRWFAEVVTDPVSAAHGASAAATLQAALGAATLEALIRPSQRMTAIERLEVYQTSYWARLVECLADDFPTMQHALGEEAFAAAARGYIARHPSSSPSLNGFGRGFPAYVSGVEGLADRGFLSDLGRLEWALVEVIHAATLPALSGASLAQVPVERWGELRLEPRPTLRFLELDHPANAYFQAVAEDREPKVPAPRRTATAVYRLGLQLWRMDVAPSMAAVLRALLAGEPLAEAVGKADGASAETDLKSSFEQWVSEGFFREVDLDPR